MANLSIIEDASSVEIKAHSNLKLASCQHENNDWHEIGSTSLSNDVKTKVAGEIDEREVAEAGDDGGRRSFNSKTRLENNVNMFEMGLMPNDAYICSFPHGDSTWTITSLVTPLSSDINELPLSRHSSMAPEGGDVDKNQYQSPQKQEHLGCKGNLASP